jgi:uncharacterized membrane protein YebE (DUF533 family)
VIDPKQLLEQVLGGNVRGAGRDLKAQLDAASGSRAFAGGAVAGGLLGLLLGGGRRRGFGGGIGSAVLGALALQAYQTYQRQRGQGRDDLVTANLEQQVLPHAQPAADGSPFELTLVRAMVGAAKADGHIDGAEQRRLFAEVERLGLDAEAKAYVFDLLTHDVDMKSLADAVGTPEQGAELYLAARLAIDADEPAERAYLDALAARLRLPAELRSSLDSAPQKASV